jgi:predicted nucleotidyltransferase
MDELQAICRRRGIVRLAVFGSALRNDFTDASDVDLLVEFGSGVQHGLSFFAIQDELGRLLGRRVDLNTTQCLSRYFREQVLAEARTIYVAA